MTDRELLVSIHAPARGATTSSAGPRRSSDSFNPRAREGRDEVFGLRDRQAIVSIHAPARGATIDGLTSCDLISVSIHAPARGAT